MASFERFRLIRWLPYNGGVYAVKTTEYRRDAAATITWHQIARRSVRVRYLLGEILNTV